MPPGSSPGARTASSSSARRGAHRGLGRPRGPPRRPDRGRRRLPRRLPHRSRGRPGLRHSAELGSMLATYVIETVGTQEYTLGKASFLSGWPRPTARSPPTRSNPTSPASPPERDRAIAVRPPGRAASRPPGVRPQRGAMTARTWSPSAGTSRRGPCSRPTAAGVFPMGLGEHGARPLGWWSPGPARRAAARRGPRQPVAAQVAAALRDAGRHRLRRGRRRRAPTRAATGGGSPRRSPTPTPSCTPWAGRTASRRGRTASSSAGSTGSPSAGCSRASRCSTGHDASKAAVVAHWRARASPTATRAGSSTCSGPPTTCAASASSRCPARTTSAAAPRPGRCRSRRRPSRQPTRVDRALAVRRQHGPGMPRGHRPRRRTSATEELLAAHPAPRRACPPVRPGRWPAPRARPCRQRVAAAWASRMTGSGQRRPRASTTTGSAAASPPSGDGSALTAAATRARPGRRRPRSGSAAQNRSTSWRPCGRTAAQRQGDPHVAVGERRPWPPGRGWARGCWPCRPSRTPRRSRGGRTRAPGPRRRRTGPRTSPRAAAGRAGPRRPRRRRRRPRPTARGRRGPRPPRRRAPAGGPVCCHASAAASASGTRGVAAGSVSRLASGSRDHPAGALRHDEDADAAGPAPGLGVAGQHVKGGGGGDPARDAWASTTSGTPALRRSTSWTCSSGWRVPTSPLACCTAAPTVPGTAMASARAAGSTRPCRSTGTVANSVSSPACAARCCPGTRTAECSTATGHETGAAAAARLEDAVHGPPHCHRAGRRETDLGRSHAEAGRDDLRGLVEAACGRCVPGQPSVRA